MNSSMNMTLLITRQETHDFSAVRADTEHPERPSAHTARFSQRDSGIHRNGLNNFSLLYTMSTGR